LLNKLYEVLVSARAAGRELQLHANKQGVKKHLTNCAQLAAVFCSQV